jgi:phosphoribosylformylglycinamidine synthase
LLISALAPVSDVRKALTMEVKGPGNALYLVGWTAEELGGSLFHQICGCCASCAAPAVDTRGALAAFKGVQSALAKGLVLAAHDLSEGGLGVAAAEMCFTGEFGASLDLDEVPRRAPIYSDEILLFSESASRVLLEVTPEHEAAFLKVMRNAPAKRVGTTMANPVLKVTGLDGRVALESALCDLKNAWQLALPRRLG